MALDLVGAVGVKVRPDARGFRDEAKRDIMAQLRDLEEELKVRVNPDVKMDKARAQRAMKDAFGDLEKITKKLPIEINVEESINGDHLKKKLQDELKDASKARIDLDTKEAHKSIDNLRHDLNKMGDAGDGLTESLKRSREEADAMGRGNTKSLNTLRDASRFLNDELADMEKLHEKQRNNAKAANIEQRIADKAHRESARETQKLQEKITELGREYSRTSGKEARQAIQDQRAAARERLATLKLERDEYKRIATERRAEARAAAAELAKTDKALGAINNRIKKNSQAQKDLNADKADFLKKSQETITSIEREIAANKGNREELEREIRVQEDLIRVRAKSNKELLETVRSIDSSLESWEQFTRGVEDGTNDNVRYFGLLARRHRDMSQSQIEDLKELERRERDLNDIRRKRVEAKAVFDNKAIQQSIQDIPTKHRAKIKLDVDRAALQLSLQSMRPVRIPIVGFMADNARWAGDVTKALSGWSIMSDISKQFKDTAANLDKISISSAKAAVGIGSVMSVAGAGLGVLGAVSNDIGRLARGALLAPAALMAFAAAGYTVKKAFAGFGDAVGGDAKALAKLPPHAREAATALGELNGKLDESVGPAVWDSIGDSMTNMVKTIEGPLLKGLTGTATETGHALKGVFEAVDSFAASGNLDQMFKLMNEGFKNSRASAGNLTSGLLALSRAGADVLPQLGTWIDDAAASFANWARTNQENGNIAGWLREAGQEAEHLGSIVGSTVGIVGALGRAAESAGYGGLQPMAEGLRKINEGANGAFFQGNMSTVFEGAAKSASHMATGLKEVGTAILQDSPTWSRAMESSGKIVENVLTGIADGLTNDRLLSGIDTFFSGMTKSSEKLGTMIPKVAQSIGDFLPLADNLVAGGLEIADAFLDMWNRSDNLIHALTNVVPAVTGLIASFVRLAHGPLLAVTDGLATVVNAFTGLPTSIQAGIAGTALAVVGFGLLAKSAIGMGIALAQAVPAIAAFGRGLTLLRGASGISGAIAAIGGSLGLFSGAATKAAGGASLLSRVMAGVTAALSPMGLALGVVGGAIAGLAWYKFDQAASASARVNELKSSLNDLGQVTSETSSLIANRLGEGWDGLNSDIRTLVSDSKNAGEALQELGLSSTDVASMLQNDRAAYDDLADAMTKLNVNTRLFKPDEYKAALETISQATGKSTDEIKAMSPVLKDTGDKMQQMASEFDKSGAQVDEFGNAIQPASEKSRALGEALRKMGEDGSSVSDKMDAARDAVEGLGGAMDSIAGKDLDLTDAITRASEAAKELSTDMNGVAQDYSDAFKKMEDGSVALDTTSQRAVELSDALRPVGEAAKEAATQLAGEGKIDEAVSALTRGKDAWQSMGEQLKLSQGEIDAAWEAIVGVTPDELETTFTLKGLEEIDYAESKMKGLGLEFDQAEYTAFLKANAEDFEAKGMDAKAQADAFVAHEYVAKLKADKSEMDSVMNEAKALGIEWDAQKFTAWLEADPANALLAANDTNAALRQFASDEYNAIITADGTDITSKIADLNQALTGITSGNNWVARITANADTFNTVLEAAKARGQEISNPDAFKAFLSMNADDFNAKKVTVEQALDLFTGMPHDVQVGAETGDAQLKVDNLDARLAEIQSKDTNARVYVSGALEAGNQVQAVSNQLTFMNKTFTANVAAVDSASTVISIPKAEAEQYAKQYNGMILATDGASATIQFPKAEAEAFQKNYTGTLTAVDNASYVTTVPKALAEQFHRQYNAQLVSTDGASSVIAIPKGQAEAFAKQYNSMMTATDSASGTIGSVQGLANRLEATDPNNRLSATDGASSVLGGVQRAANMLASTHPNNRLSATDNASGTIGNVQGSANTLGRTHPTPTITAIDRASGVIAGIAGALAGLRDRVVNVFTRHSSNRAEGGFESFASGGITRRIVHSYAGGGNAYTRSILNSSELQRRIMKAERNPHKESHVAQIARPSSRVRIWAEPETGGEAYIPLASSKRARSTQIWADTGDRLGIDMKAFAQGGFGQGKASGNQSGTAGANAPGGVHVEVTNHYPQAEPTSVTTNKALQFAAHLM